MYEKEYKFLVYFSEVGEIGIGESSFRDDLVVVDKNLISYVFI